jgi:hypothetical protein
MCYIQEGVTCKERCLFHASLGYDLLSTFNAKVVTGFIEKLKNTGRARCFN